MKILVTGAAGFIGMNASTSLSARGHDVVGIDNFNDYYNPKVKRWRQAQLELLGIPIYKCDVRDSISLENLFQSHHFDAVVHLAAMAGVRSSCEIPQVYFDVNINGTLNVLECMRQNNVKKFILASTSSLYAGNDLPFCEDNNVAKPLSPYAASKLGAEGLAHSYSHLYDMDVSALRFFTVYGPAGRPDMAPYKFTNWILNEEPIRLFGDGNKTRDFTYITDISSGITKAIELNSRGFETYNLGGGDNISISDLIEKISAACRKKAIVHYEKNAPGDMAHTFADTSKAGKELQWKPETSTDNGIQQMVRWHLDVLPKLSL